MRRRIGEYFILTIGFAAFAESIDLSGTVADKSNKPITGAIVTLQSKNLTDTTNSKGEYSIINGTIMVNPFVISPRIEEISLSGGIIRFNLTKPDQVRIELFDVKGNLLKRALNNYASAGVYRFSVMPDPLVANMTAIRVSIGQRVSTFRYLPLQNGKSTVYSCAAAVSPKGGQLARIQIGVDSLKASASGYNTKLVPITSYREKMNITLDSALPPFSFFVTSMKALQELSGKKNGFGGDLRFGKTGPGAGLRGADSICECIAEKSMPGSKIKIWRAFLSAAKDEDGKQVNAIDRIGTGPWYDRRGRLLAPSLADLLHTRPENGNADIKNDLPNENGIPNHRPDPSKPEEDNHHMVTGTGTDGKLYSAKATCNDWTSKTADGGKPYGGLSWPRNMGGMGGGGGLGLGSAHWMAGLALCGCRDSIAIIESGGPPANCDFIGGGGGYGGFYCFAKNP